MNYCGTDFEFEERVLAHLKAAIGAKLRRHESFFVNWSRPLAEGSGRMSLWISPFIPLSFRFLGSRPPELNPRWLRALAQLAYSPRRLVVLSEAEAESYAKAHHIA